MSLWEYAICTTEEVWDYLDPAQEDKDKYEALMERWINGASMTIEQLLDRPIVQRNFQVYQNGNGYNTLYLHNYPVVEVHEITIFDYDLANSTDIDPLRASGEVVIDQDTGAMLLLPNSPRSRWTKGLQNIYIDYDAGFSGTGLAPFKEVVMELIQVVYRDQGTNPRVQQLNDNVGNSVFTGRYSPNRLSHQSWMLVQNYRRVST